MKMTSSGSASILVTVLAMSPLAGCRGDIGNAMDSAGGPNVGGTGTGTGGMPAMAGMTLDGTMDPNQMCAPNAGRSPLRRLNRDEYANTIHDLFPKDKFPRLDAKIDSTVNTFPLDELKLGFTNNADALTTSGILAGDYISSAETFATEATTAANL